MGLSKIQGFISTCCICVAFDWVSPPCMVYAFCLVITHDDVDLDGQHSTQGNSMMLIWMVSLQSHRFDDVDLDGHYSTQGISMMLMLMESRQHPYVSLII